MKKIIVAVLCVALIVCVFGACKMANIGENGTTETLFSHDGEDGASSSDVDPDTTEFIVPDIIPTEQRQTTTEKPEHTTQRTDDTTDVSATVDTTNESTTGSDIADIVRDAMTEQYAKPVPKNPDGSDYKIPDSLLTPVRTFTDEEIKSFKLSDLDGKSLKQVFDDELISKMFSTVFIAKGNVKQYYAYINENTFGIVYKEVEKRSKEDYDAYVDKLSSGVGSAAMGIDLAIEGLLMHLDANELTVIFEYRDIDNNIMMNFSCSESAE